MDSILTEGQKGESWIAQALQSGITDAIIPGGELNISSDAHITAGKSIHITGGAILLNYGSSIIIEKMAELALSDVSIVGDGSGTLISVQGGRLILKEGSALSGGFSQTEEAGGAVTVSDQGELILDGGGIYSSIAIKGGGALVKDGSMQVASGEITGCSATYGGGVYVTEKGVLKLGSNGANGGVGSMFFANKAGEAGAYTIYGNSASQDGADIYAISQKAASPAVEYATVAFEARGGAPLAPLKVPMGVPIALPQTHKAGFAFGGWHKDEQCLIPLDEGQPIFSDIAVYAKWAPSTLLINFATFGGSPVTPRRIYYGERLAMPDSPVLPGYSFIGWTEDENGGMPFDWMAPITKNFTLYANWKNESNMAPNQESTIIIADFEEISPEEDSPKPQEGQEEAVKESESHPQASEASETKAQGAAKKQSSSAKSQNRSTNQKTSSKQPSKASKQTSEKAKQNGKAPQPKSYQSPASPSQYQFAARRQRSSSK